MSLVRPFCNNPLTNIAVMAGLAARVADGSDINKSQAGSSHRKLSTVGTGERARCENNARPAAVSVGGPAAWRSAVQRGQASRALRVPTGPVARPTPSSSSKCSFIDLDNFQLKQLRRRGRHAAADTRRSDAHPRAPLMRVGRYTVSHSEAPAPRRRH